MNLQPYKHPHARMGSLNEGLKQEIRILVTPGFHLYARKNVKQVKLHRQRTKVSCLEAAQIMPHHRLPGRYNLCPHPEDWLVRTWAMTSWRRPLRTTQATWKSFSALRRSRLVAVWDRFCSGCPRDEHV